MPMSTQPWASSSSSSSAAACDDVAAVVPSPVADFISDAVPVAVAADVVDDVVDEVEAGDGGEVRGGEVRGGEGEGGGGEGGGVEGGGGEGGGGGNGGGGFCSICADVAGGEGGEVAQLACGHHLCLPCLLELAGRSRKHPLPPGVTVRVTRFGGAAAYPMRECPCCRRSVLEAVHVLGRPTAVEVEQQRLAVRAGRVLEYRTYVYVPLPSHV
jgi:hypothetical protein